MRVRSGPASRAGYTLVELMIVIAIVAVLASLLLGAVNRARDAGKKTAAVAEMSQIDAAVAKFKFDFGFSPPEEITFPRTSSPASGSAEEKGLRLLQKMFRGFGASGSLPAVPYMSTVPSVRAAGLDEDNLFDGHTFRGTKALLFFLAGPELQGFKPNSPESPTGTSKKGPYFEFTEGQLYLDKEQLYASLAAAERGRLLPAIQDPWKRPYAYFSSGSGATYDPARTLPVPGRTGAGVLLAPFRANGQAAGPWANPSGVQLISSGPDQEFGTAYTAGTGTVWNPGQGEYADTSATGFGADDLSNFNGGAPLGVKGK